MVVILGLDLKEMQWRKFKGSNMFSRVYYLRPTKMIVYQLALILCVCSESVGTAALSEYIDQQRIVEHLNPMASVYNNDFVGMASYNIFVGIAVAFVFGSAFFFDLFWPERHESEPVRLAWRICAVSVSVMALSSALGMTVITATRSAYVTGVSAAKAAQLLSESKKNPNLGTIQNASLRQS